MPGNAVPVYEALAADIKAMGVEVAFGLISDDTALFVATLDAIGVRFVGTRHENTATAMAEGYAVSTGRLGVAVLGRGPATANALHASAYACRGNSRVLLVFGEAAAQVSVNGYGPDLKQFDAQGVLRAAGLRVFIANEPYGARQTLAAAAAATYDGATALLLPVDVQQMHVDMQATQPAPVAPAPARSAHAPRKSAIDAAAALLAASRKPLIIAGWGVCEAGARDELIALADHLGAALGTTLKAKDLFRGCAMNVGIVGSYSHAGGRRLIDEADCVIAFGAGLNARTTAMGSALPKGVPVIHVDRDRGSIGRWFAADVALVGDARLAALALRDALPVRAAQDKPFLGEPYRSWLDGFDLSADFTPQHTAHTVDARALALALDRLIPADRNVVYDAGNFLQVVPYLGIPDPRRLRQASDFASIGLGFGAALGYACATPQATTVLVVGDGGLLMTLGELETVVREDIPLVVVVMNDAAYGAEVHYLKMRDMPVSTSAFADVDFAPIAQALGFSVATIRSMQDLEDAAALIRNPDGPVLLDCKINGAIPAPWLFDGH
jgi:thiamine pyrophosphate-dependent acetolactate synthase large subunit-like protein